MSMTPASLLRHATLLRRLRNRLFNAAASLLCGQRLSVDWSDLKVIHPERIVIGDRFQAGRGLWLESVDGQGQIVIGADVNVSDHVHIGSAREVRIGDGVLIGSKVLVSDHSHGLAADASATPLVRPNDRPIVVKGPTTIGRSAWIGDGTCILGGVTVGDGAIVGANSVVVRDVPPATVWAGVPARQVWPRADAGDRDGLPPAMSTNPEP